MNWNLSERAAFSHVGHVGAHMHLHAQRTQRTGSNVHVGTHMHLHAQRTLRTAQNTCSCRHIYVPTCAPSDYTVRAMRECCHRHILDSKTLSYSVKTLTLYTCLRACIPRNLKPLYRMQRFQVSRDYVAIPSSYGASRRCTRSVRLNLV